MNDFVTVLGDLIREATVAEVIAAVNSATAHAPARRSSPLAETRAPSATARGGQQRTPEHLAQLMGRVHGHINSNPGHSVGTIAVSLGTAPKELSLVLRKLLDDKKVVSKGKKRGTRYFPR